MDKLLLLMLISIAYLCDAGPVHNKSNWFAISGSKESEEDPDNAPSCGQILPLIEFKTEKRITRGKRYSNYVEFPWMALLFVHKRKYQQCTPSDSDCWYERCGGSLIALKVVLLTGKCVYDYKQDKLKVRAGDWNLDTFGKWHPYQERLVHKIIIHPQYSDAPKNRSYLQHNDVALLVMESPYTLADNIACICLPPPNLNVAPTGCKVAGRAKKIVKEIGYKPFLIVTDLNYVDHDQCERNLRQNWWSDLVLHDSFTCADGVLDAGACQTDRGSALMCIADDYYYARSIMSWSIGCGLSNTTHVFTDIIKARNWIDQEMKANGFTTHTYTPVAYRE